MCLDGLQRQKRLCEVLIVDKIIHSKDEFFLQTFLNFARIHKLLTDVTRQCLFFLVLTK
jgi:hypothetical protein